MPALSVVLPTYNEAANVGPLLQELRSVLGDDAELLVVDDDSQDGTADVARRAGARVIVRKDERGLATAVVRGLAEARGDHVVVMDADGQHPVEAVARMHAKAQATGADMVIGSRYVEDGSDQAFGAVRRVISGGAKLLSHISLPQVRRHKLTDPMSGLFLVRRDAVDLDALRPKGYKILLEILARCPVERVEEVGFEFQDRRGGDSKLGPTVILQYLIHVLALGWQQPENQRLFRFGMVGLTGVVVNLGLLTLLTEVAGLFYLLSAAISVEASIVTNFLLNDAWTFRDRREGHRLTRLAKFNTVSLLALGLNIATLAFLAEVVGLHYLVAEAFAILVTFTFNYLGNINWTYGGKGRFRLSGHVRRWLPWLPWLLVVVTASGFLLDDLDRPDEIYFDEHYYVTVAYQALSGEWEDPCWDQADPAARPLNFEHPPLAKLLITANAALVDPDVAHYEVCREPDSREYEAFTSTLRDEGTPFAWRLAPALFGIAAVALTGLAAARLTGSPGAAAVASALAATDGVLFTSSRMAILDIFVTAFVVAALYAATFPTRRGIVAASLLLALGFACKYTAVFAGLPVLLVMLWSQWRAGNLTRRRFDGSILGAVLTPLPVLALTYTPWWILWLPRYGFVGAIRHWIDILVEAIKWHATVQSDHAYASRPIEWPLLERPVFYYAAHDVGGVTGMDGYIYGIPNPVLWWGAGLALVGLLAAAAWGLYKQRSILGWFRGLPLPGQGAALAVAAFAVTYGGFLSLSRESFLFYTTILAPLLALVLTTALVALWRHRPTWGRLAGAVVVLLAVAAFAHYHPVLTAQTISDQRFDAIMDLVPWMRR